MYYQRLEFVLQGGGNALPSAICALTLFFRRRGLLPSTTGAPASAAKGGGVLLPRIAAWVF